METERRWKWIRLMPFNSAHTECTQNYLADGNLYVNDATGWVKHPTDYIDVKVPEHLKPPEEEIEL